MRLGLFGGTFDPPHIGHLIVAQDALSILGLDRLLLIPASVPPHKRDREVSPPELRMELLQAAVGDDSRLEVSDIELRRSGPSFTVDTLRELHRRQSGAELFLLIGSDQYRELATWHESAEVVRLATLAVIAREGDAPVPGTGVPHVPVPVTRIDISSTQIRRRVREGAAIRYLVPSAVERLIRSHGLYLFSNDRPDTC